MPIAKYFREAISELHRVTWPTRAQAIKISLTVLAITFVIAIALGFFDTFLAWLYRLLLEAAN